MDKRSAIRWARILVSEGLSVAAAVFAALWIWRWVQIVHHAGFLGNVVHPHPANYDTFPYLSVAIACAAAALLVLNMPERFTVRSLLFTTTLVAVVLSVVVWLAR